MTTSTDIHDPTGDDLREAAFDRLKKRVTSTRTGSTTRGRRPRVHHLGPDRHRLPRPLIVMGFWGVGLIMNAYDVYGRKPICEGEIQREIERLRGA